jgi:long-subunit acyl-CoA synthetase (AMP-forming)
MNTLSEQLRLLSQSVDSACVALADDEKSISYTELVDRISSVSDWLSLRNVSVVALQARNSIDWVIVDLACQMAKVVLLPLPDFFSLQQSANCLRAAGAEYLLSDNAQLEGLFNDADITSSTRDAIPELHYNVWELEVGKASERPLGTQKITFTSGSTGSPKGVCLSLDHQLMVAQSLAEVIAVDQPKHLCLLPLATLLENIAGIYSPLLCGGNVVIPNAENRGLSGSSGLDLQRLIQCITHRQPNTLILLPQLLNALVFACQTGWKPPSSLKFVAVGGGKVAPELVALARGFGLPVYEGYGLSECGSVVALNTPSNDKPDMVGKVLPHCEVKVEDGEVMVSGASHLGYLGQPESWFPESIATGDLGVLADGWLKINGRSKNLLISSFGRNISPEWVESVFNAKPLLSQCVVLGDARPYLSAFLSAPDFVGDESINQWVNEVNSQLPDYAKIQAWQRFEPDQWQGCLTANGRPQRQRINEYYADLIESLYQKNEVACSN